MLISTFSCSNFKVKAKDWRMLRMDKSGIVLLEFVSEILLNTELK